MIIILDCTFAEPDSSSPFLDIKVFLKSLQCGRVVNCVLLMTKKMSWSQFKTYSRYSLFLWKTYFFAWCS